MQKKNYKIELVRFIAACLIMDAHFDNGYLHNIFHFTWVYVDFFFIITGYLTAKKMLQIINLNEKFSFRKLFVVFKEVYFNKFVALLGFTIVPTIIRYLGYLVKRFHSFSILQIIDEIKNMFLEIIYLGQFVPNYKMFPLWYIYILVIVLPIFIILLFVKSKVIKFVIFIFYSIYYFNIGYLFPGHSTIAHFVRCCNGIGMGYMAYEISNGLQIIKPNKYLDSFITILELLSFLSPILLDAFGMGEFRLILVCHFLFIICSFSNRSIIDLKENNLMLYLGRLSIPIYVWHTIIYGIITNSNLFISKYAIFGYICVLFVGIINIEVLKICRRKM